VEAAEHEVDIVVEGLFLHEAIVYRSIPKQKREKTNHRDIHDTSAQILAAVGSSAGKDKDACNHIDNECGEDEEPELEDPCDEWPVLLWDFLVDRVVNQGEERGKVVPAMFPNVFGLLVESSFTGLEVTLPPAKLLHSVDLLPAGNGVIERILERVRGCEWVFC